MVSAAAALASINLGATRAAWRLARRFPELLAGEPPRQRIIEKAIESAAGKGRSYELADSLPSARTPDLRPLDLLLLHGAAEDGMDDPRLVNLARHLAAHGFRVVTPNLEELRRLRLTAASLAAVRAWMLWTSEHRAGGQPVGVFGISFAGGLALTAAAEAEAAPAVGYVVALGAHGDLERVVRGWLSATQGPEGGGYYTPQDPYGRRLFLLANLDTFVGSAEAEILAPALEALVYRGRPQPRLEETALSPVGRRLWAVARDEGALSSSEAEPLLAAAGPALASLSPENQGAPRCPVLLVHGSADPVVPASECSALARHLRQKGGDVRVLVTPLLSHVVKEGAQAVHNAPFADQARLFFFLRAWMIAARCHP